ncbi:uncharacterized protein N7482_010541 [Penicillium canariense]|uniref:Uncharacterized protein n=1 Tax=Penicillium canariense TaxID=189055 RepID=A0A9W9HPD9_9EURO|nr:uncharacterized protein N7482_010541 [Penicillium canariense]KAJ5151289.1 hypothetical protein N7482_010541 [Penicillium canariense]
MGFFDNDSEEYRHHEVMTNRPHEAKWSHELIGGAAAYEAMKAYEDHEARNGTHARTLYSPDTYADQATDIFLDTGQIDNHAKAKEVVAGLIGAFVDREVETKGLDFVDREKAKRHARERAEHQMEQSGRW